MFKHPHPIDAVSASAVAPIAQSVTSQDVTPAPTAPPQVGMSQQDSSATSAGPSTAAQTDQASLQRQLDAALKNTNYKAEITTESGGYTILKIVQSETGQVILQMPSQTALAIVASLSKSDHGAGAQVPAGAVFSELA